MVSGSWLTGHIIPYSFISSLWTHYGFLSLLLRTHNIFSFPRAVSDSSFLFGWDSIKGVLFFSKCQQEVTSHILFQVLQSRHYYSKGSENTMTIWCSLFSMNLYLLVSYGCLFRVSSVDELLFFLRTSEINLFYNLQVFYWHFLEILWLFIFLVLYLWFLVLYR